MCGRFSLFVAPDDLEERFGAEAAVALEPRYNLAPGDDVAVVRNDAPDAIHLAGWGLVPAWVDDPDDWPAPSNARAETVAERPAFRDAFAERRCLVLADGFYEWTGRRGSKQPHRVVRPDREPFAMAGLWARRDADGGHRDTTTIVTTDANDPVSRLHDRMPVVLAPGEERRWLAGDDPEDLRALLDPYPDDGLETYPVSRAVNDPSNDDPSVVEPVDVGQQSGLEEFG